MESRSAKALEEYLRALRDIRASGEGVAEISYYPALSNLLNQLGSQLKPKVHCITSTKNRGAGIPDGGLFTPEQLRNIPQEQALHQLPARGIIEVKPPSDDAWLVADGEQVTRYWGKYRQVLVTNLRDFVLVGQDTEGNPVKLETYRLADSEAAFWKAAAVPKSFAKQHGDRLGEYLHRVMLHSAPLSTPQELASVLAAYAREAKARVENAELDALVTTRKALEETVGLTFEAKEGDDFFRSTLVQTLLYGVFSAWVLWSKQHLPGDKTRFNWHETAWWLHVPMIRALYEQLAAPAKLGPLNLVEVLDWAAAALNRVDRASFFEKFEEGQAVEYFYEPFLEAFDPELRKELGVWYTPPEIVQYMVARVDTVLRQELGLADGLADPNVYVLDPCAGTGSYLVEVLRRINKTLTEKGADALAAHDVKLAAMKRVFGFEILPAPFVVSHLRLGLLLQNLGVPLADPERVGVYLTNALTGWEPLDPAKEKAFQGMLTGFPELLEERDHAKQVKQEVPILVVLGNPPYNAFAGTSPEEEQGLVEPYKEGLMGWGITKNYLDDLYVRFFRLAERRIAEQTGRGVVSFISNHSWVSDPSFVVLRWRLLESFDRFWIENLHGNRNISEYAPDGRTSETIFARTGFSAGIRQGVVTSLWVKTGDESEQPKVLFRDDLSAAKAAERRAQLVESLDVHDFDAQYETVTPTKENRYSFRPGEASAAYRAWPPLRGLSAVEPQLGLNENRSGALQDLDRDRLQNRMSTYLDRAVSWTQVEAMQTGLSRPAAGFDPPAVRQKVQAREPFDATRIVRYLRRPFEHCWAYVSDVSPLWNRSRPELRSHHVGFEKTGTLFLLSRPAAVSKPEGVPLYVTGSLGEQDSLRGHAYFIPIRLRPPKTFEEANEENTAGVTANLSPAARVYLASLGITSPDADAETAGLIWMHALAIGYSPVYLTENADGIRQDWPRVPLPGSHEGLLASAALGCQVAALLDTEQPVPGVTSGTIRPDLQAIAVVSREGGGSLNVASGDLAVTAGWGHAGKGGVTMPGKGKIVERDYTPEERTAMESGAEALGLSASEAFTRLGDTTRDIYLNDRAYWCNVPAKVWDYVIGGYQVIKKWLSYRERILLGRSLTPDEVREVMNTARRIAAILLLEPALDANYQASKETVYPWPGQ